MADYSTIRDAILVCRRASVSLFVWGSHGIGKSSVVRQTAQNLGIGFVDFRCAQLEPSDLRGLPDRGPDNKTHFLPPAELPDSGDGILFLDELNRASPEVLSAAFQLVLDRQIGVYKLPVGWSIVCAGNFGNSSYQVTELDPALLDRFCHIILSAGPSTAVDWGMWMLERYPGIAEEIISYCEMDAKNLESVGKQELGFQIKPSRRSWEMVARCLNVIDSGRFPSHITLEVVAGLIGRELAVEYLRKRKCPLTVAQFLNSSLNTSLPILRSMTRPQHSQFSKNLACHLSFENLSETVASKALDYLSLLMKDQRDLAINLAKQLVSCNLPASQRPPHHMEMALLSDPEFVLLINKTRAANQAPVTMLDYLSKRRELSQSIAKALNFKPESKSETAA